MSCMGMGGTRAQLLWLEADEERETEGQKAVSVLGSPAVLLIGEYIPRGHGGSDGAYSGIPSSVSRGQS